MSGREYNARIAVREFSDEESFGLQNLISEDIDIIGIDAFASDLEQSGKNTPQQRFLQNLKRFARQRDIGFLPLRSHTYDRKKIIKATPRLRRAHSLPEAAAYFFEKKLQASIAKKRIHPGFRFLLLVKPEAQEIFTHYMMKKAQPLDQRLNTGSITNLYTQELFRYAHSKHANRSTFMGQQLSHEERTALIDIFEIGYKEVKRCLDIDQEKINSGRKKEIRNDYDFLLPSMLP